MVKVKQAPKPRKCIKNTDLPAQVLDDGAWQEVILPTLMFWAGFQRDPWVVNDEPLANTLLIIGHTTVGPTYQLTANGRTLVEVARVSHSLLIPKEILDEYRPLNGSVMAGEPFLVLQPCTLSICSSRTTVLTHTTIECNGLPLQSIITLTYTGRRKRL